MPYSGGSPLRRALEARRSNPWPSDQIANIPDTAPGAANLTPSSDVAADAVKAGFAPLLSGQSVPRIGERVYDYACEPCQDE